MNALPARAIELIHGTAGRPVTIPQLGFGTYKITPHDTETAVRAAIELGYRHIDTAQMYGNEAQVGKAIAGCGLPRDQLFITSKLNNTAHEPARARESFDATLRALGLEVLDLFLVHWPMALSGDLIGTWATMIEFLDSGRVRAIGVSNHQREHLETIIKATGVTPAVNQIEIHPYLTQEPLRTAHRQLGIVTQAWSPLGRGHLLRDPVIESVARATGHTSAQVVLRWHLQRGDVVFPKSVHPERIAENSQLFDFELDDDQLARISALNRDHRFGSHPDEVQGAK
ncbi:2,5-diketo-D-gluconate reductase A [Propionibacterium cyclohexanicum]|uniref:2,5-diketo-D-gluconate reductase A n=1 Tax=Propionibacterium cyclohexanicum TaxID=64702 RepID=A0A1H9RXT9_9ACTN|nr:aldo/keto reductase [Propionibacterium cyclohexanicum]SER77454.1 2,5-diketo-D-gluconate reductase A [Propionibacterium cyclohexanicum]